MEEAAATVELLDTLLAAPVFAEVQAMTVFPSSNQVLHKRFGYRQVFRAWVEFELASELCWDGGEAVYKAGSKNVATLYEYWVFFHLARTVAALAHVSFDLSGFFQLSPSRIDLNLKQGRSTVLYGTTLRHGRRIALELWFNRTFTSTSWSNRPMRPDYSLKISAAKGERAHFDPVWVHFDAKYRVDEIVELFGPRKDDPVTPEVRKKAKRSDLLKMHAYRDAIRRSAGAYIIYPGTQTELAREYHELLPGLGAFALRPNLAGTPDGAASIASFLDDILVHLSSQFTQHERARYWEVNSFGGETTAGLMGPATPNLSMPPADTIVLLGYVRGPEHLEWIMKQRLYNVRADGRSGALHLGTPDLRAEYVVLYGPGDGELPQLWILGSSPRVLAAEQMAQLEYPRKPGRMYFCLELIERVRMPTEIMRAKIENLSRLSNKERYAPFSVTWTQLFT